MDGRQLKFAKHYALTNNAYRSAIAAGYSENYAKSQSYKLLDNVGIRDEIEKAQNDILEEIKNLIIPGANKALRYMLDALEDKEVPPTVKKDIAKDLLDRAGFKPVDRQETTGTIQIQKSPYDELTVEELRKLAGRDAP